MLESGLSLPNLANERLYSIGQSGRSHGIETHAPQDEHDTMSNGFACCLRDFFGVEAS